MERNVNNWERAASIGAGALIALAGMRARGRMRSSLFSSAAGLAFRGVSGYCPINQLLGRECDAVKAWRQSVLPANISAAL